MNGSVRYPMNGVEECLMIPPFSERTKLPLGEGSKGKESPRREMIHAGARRLVEEVSDHGLC